MEHARLLEESEAPGISFIGKATKNPFTESAAGESDRRLLWQDEHWGDALGKFALATGVTVSAYTRHGHRFSGPHLASPLTCAFEARALWPENATFSAFEKRLVEECFREAAPIARKFLGALTVSALPCWSTAGEMIGILVYGWVFDHFPDPIECRRLSGSVDMEEAFLWAIARSSVPTSPQQLATCKGLLAALSTAIVDNLIARSKEAMLLAQKEQLLVDLEKERERLSAVLKELEASIKIGEDFLASVSHDLRTPLSVILTNTQILRNKITDTSLIPIVERLESNVEKEARLVDDLLDITRIKSGKLRIDMATVDLSEVLDDSLDSVAGWAVERRIALRIGHRERMPVRGDALRPQQVFWNLLSNAIKFTPEGGSVEVSLALRAEHAVVTVLDSGRGITREFLPKVFDKFAQAGDEGLLGNSGLGLGLSIARSIVELHGGTIDVRSEGHGKGSTFTVVLPLIR